VVGLAAANLQPEQKFHMESILPMKKGWIMMKEFLLKKRRCVLLVNAFLIYTWITMLSSLVGTDIYYSVYVLCAIVGLLCLCDNFREDRDEPKRRPGLLWLFSAVFSFAVLLANYALFEPLSVLQNLLEVILGFLGGLSIGYQILLCMCRRLPIVVAMPSAEHPRKVFLFSFLSISAIDLVYLFFVRYPGVLTTDSFSTIAQIIGAEGYNNTMPFWHTITVLPFYRLGVLLLGDANGGAALFHCAQILFLSGCFSYALLTMYQCGMPRYPMACFYALYAFMPYNIVYSITLWKDVLFAGAVLLFLTAVYRVLRPVGDHAKADNMLLICGGLGISLWRTNGWVAFAITGVVFLVLLRKQYKRLLSRLFAVLVASWILLNPVLKLFSVSPTNLVEAFAVPMQQIARVVANDRDLTAEQEKLLSDIFWIDKMADLYDPQTVDPIKFETFRYDQVDVIKEDPSAYLKLYFSLGMRYPGDYLKAWIEETKGYWNGGYSYWIYTLEVDANEFGIAHTGSGSFIARLYGALFRYVERLAILQPLMSIGLHVWMLAACCAVNMLKKRWEGLLCVLPLVLMIGLILGAPVFSEFRYAYPLVISLPLILCTTFYEGRKIEE